MHFDGRHGQHRGIQYNLKDGAEVPTTSDDLCDCYGCFDYLKKTCCGCDGGKDSHGLNDIGVDGEFRATG